MSKKLLFGIVALVVALIGYFIFTPTNNEEAQAYLKEGLLKAQMQAKSISCQGNKPIKCELSELKFNKNNIFGYDPKDIVYKKVSLIMQELPSEEIKTINYKANFTKYDVLAGVKSSLKKEISLNKKEQELITKIIDEIPNDLRYFDGNYDMDVVASKTIFSGANIKNISAQNTLLEAKMSGNLKTKEINIDLIQEDVIKFLNALESNPETAENMFKDENSEFAKFITNSIFTDIKYKLNFKDTNKLLSQAIKILEKVISKEEKQQMAAILRKTLAIPPVKSQEMPTAGEILQAAKPLMQMGVGFATQNLPFQDILLQKISNIDKNLDIELIVKNPNKYSLNDLKTQKVSIKPDNFIEVLGFDLK